MTPRRALTLVELLAALALSSFVLIAVLGWLDLLRDAEATDAAQPGADMAARLALEVVAHSLGNRSEPSEALLRRARLERVEDLVVVRSGSLHWFARVPSGRTIETVVARLVFDEASGELAIESIDERGEIARTPVLLDVLTFEVIEPTRGVARVRVERAGWAPIERELRW